jgi:hypothetical protein
MIKLLSAGTCTVVANQAGNAKYFSAPSVYRSFTVSMATQTISFAALANKTLLQSPVTVSATASSGLPVSFLAITPSVCTSGGANGASIKLVGVGTCTVVAYQLGNREYFPALPAAQSFRVLASTTLTTTPSATRVTLGTSAVTLKDTAVLSGGSHPTGAITFTLFYNGGTTPVDTETVTVSGNGTYTTPTGYSLPGTGTVTGTYQWDAPYSGDTNNPSVSEDNVSNEEATVLIASPSLSTTPSSTSVTVGTSSLPLKDTAVLSGGYHPTGAITFTLFYNGSTTPVDTETVTVSGNGTYATPTGYSLPGTGTVTGTYQWDASYSGDTNNASVSDNSAAAEQVTVTPVSPSLSTTPNPTTVTLGSSSVTLTDSALLAGGYNETGTITFTLYYDGGTTPVDTETATVSGNGTYATPTGYTLPAPGTVTGTYQWDASYSGDGNNASVSDNGAANEQVTVSAATSYSSSTPGTYTTDVAGGTYTVTLVGGGGGGGPDVGATGGAGGSGGSVSATITVPSGGTTITFVVGAGGGGSSGSANGTGGPGFGNGGVGGDAGGGGGGSAIYAGAGDLVLVAGGGGGGGSGYYGTDAFPFTGGAGGDGGVDGGAGTSNAVPSDQSYLAGQGGGGGTQSSVGAGGNNLDTDTHPTDSDGSPTSGTTGGGGGVGEYSGDGAGGGGGGGGAYYSGAGGGGGSSYLGGGGSVTVSGTSDSPDGNGGPGGTTGAGSDGDAGSVSIAPAV